MNEVISRFRAPERIHTDKGQNFEAQLFKEMCNLFSIEKTRTTPYHPESDGMVERMNSTIQDMLAKYVAEHQRDWDVHLPMVRWHTGPVSIPLPSTHPTTCCLDMRYGCP